MKKPVAAAPPPAAPADPEASVGTGTAALVYFALSLLYFLPAFLPGQGIYGTDYLAGGYPFQEFISARFAAGELPKWVPYVYGGLPFYSSPGNGYHPVRLLAELLLPTSRILVFVFWFHFGVAGLGMYLLARELGCRRWVAFVAGIAFQFTGITHSWVFAGHDGRVMVVTLAPLFFYFLHRGIRTGRVAPFAGAALALGFALLSFQIQNTYYLLLAGAAWAVFSLVRLGAFRRGAAAAGKAVGLGLAAVAFGFLLAAVNFLPFLDYVEDSPRGGGGRGYEFSTSYSMPPQDLLGLAVPEQVGSSVGDPETGAPLFPAYHGGRTEFKLHTEYVGAFVLVLLAVGAWYSRRSRYWWFFAGLGLVFLTLALGGNTPLYRLYYAVLPGIKQFRAPDLAYYVLAFSLITMAALTLERLAELRAAARARRPVPGADAEPRDSLSLAPLLAAGVAVLAVLGAGALGGQSAEAAALGGGLSPAQGWLRFAVFAGLIAAALWLWLSGRMGNRAALAALALLTLADLWIIDRKFFHVGDAPEAVFAEDDVAAFFKNQRERSRVWVVPGQSAWPRWADYPMVHGIDQAGGEHPNPLQRWYDFVGAGEQSYVDWHNFTDPRFLAAANVRWLVISSEVQVPWLREAYRGTSALVYENAFALPRAYLVPEVAVVSHPDSVLPRLQSPEWDPRRTAVVEARAPLALPGGPLEGSAQVTAYEPDRVVVRARASRPALLVLADNMYDGWQATVDGRAAEIHRTNHTFRGVVVPAGEHTVEFRFEVPDVRAGFLVYLGGFVLLALYGAFLLVGWLRGRRAAGAGTEG
ncbi:MAG TPA: YfhO family protein [Longimicrobiaceae bacterium]|nr:YfhO family protein [Longimicrobiaceae bacterium]